MDNKPQKAEKVGNTIKRILGETLNIWLREAG